MKEKLLHKIMIDISAICKKGDILMYMMYDNNRILLKILSTLHDRPENRSLAELISKTFKKIDMSKVKHKSETYVTVIKKLSEVIFEERENVVLSDDEFEEILEMCTTRENVADIANIKNAFTYAVNDRDIDTIVKNCETFNKISIISERSNDIAEMITASTSFVDLPRNAKKMEDMIKDMYHKLSEETVQKSHRELILLPGPNTTGEYEGLRDVQEDIQREASIVLKTGIKGFDNIIFKGGIMSGKLTVIGSYAGGGKSITMLELLLGMMLCPDNRSLYDIPEFKGKKIVVMIVTYENTLLQTYRRLMKLLGFGKEYINRLKYKDLLSLMSKILENAPIGMVIKAKDARTESAVDIANYIKDIEDKHNVYVACIGHDYINLTVPVKESKSQNEFMDAGQVAEDLREVLCKGMNKAVISAIQVKREWEDKYIDSVKRGDKMPIRCFTGASIFGGNIIKQKTDNFIFVVYSILNGKPYTEVLLDKDRDGNAADQREVEVVNKNLNHLFDEFQKQKDVLMSMIETEDASVKEFYGSDGRLAIAIPRAGLAFKHDEYYNDRFEIEPEASKFMDMFQEDKSETKVLPKEVYQPDEEVKELEAEVPYGTGIEEKAA